MFHNLQTISPSRRRLIRICLGLGATAVATVALPGAAQAHVSVQPGTTEGGDFSVIAFRVPNERDDARTTRLRVTLPNNQPIGSVQTTPLPGWKVATATRHLDEPIDMFGEQLDTVVSQVTWTATEGGIRPGQFQDFDLSLGQLPASGDLVFNALQTYSDGERVNWNQVAADPSVEPEHPAPTLTLTAAPAEGSSPETAGQDTPAGGETDQGAQATQNDQGAPAAPANTESDQAVPVILSGVALLVSVATAVLVWRRGRPGTPPTQVAASPAPEDINA